MNEFEDAITDLVEAVELGSRPEGARVAKWNLIVERRARLIAMYQAQVERAEKAEKALAEREYLLDMYCPNWDDKIGDPR